MSSPALCVADFRDSGPMLCPSLGFSLSEPGHGVRHGHLFPLPGCPCRSARRPFFKEFHRQAYKGSDTSFRILQDSFGCDLDSAPFLSWSREAPWTLGCCVQSRGWGSAVSRLPSPVHPPTADHSGHNRMDLSTS